jgi:glucose-6-phosphate-specific signal transduction histidine kinase
MDTQKDAYYFRIVQEAFNNIIRHAKASNTARWFCIIAQSAELLEITMTV